MTRITVDAAAQRLNCTPQFLRLALQQNQFPEFGRAVRTSKGRYTYWIDRQKLLKFLGEEEI